VAWADILRDMAIYHFSAQVIGRGAGRSSVAAAAYRAGTELVDERLGRTHDFSDKPGVVHSEIMLPEDAPAAFANRATLWNAVEAGEKRADAQVAREVSLALPREMGQAQAIALARDFVREQFVTRGMIADLNVHWGVARDGEAQPHAHVMLTMREVGPEGFGLKQRDWNDRALLAEWRERWAELANERLASLGIDQRIDHRTLAEQGVGLEPQHKIGPAGMRRGMRGEDAERAAEHQAIARRNGERILESPSLALEAITRQQSTFTRQELARFVDRHTADAAQFTAVMARVEASPEIVRVGMDDRGRERFTTRDMLATEQRLEQGARELAGRVGHEVGESRQAAALRGAEHRLEGEQRTAFLHVTGGADLSVVVGHAGTGKSTMLGVARAAWETEGLRVRGAALSGIAAQGLEEGSGIRSRTLHSLLHQLEQGRDPLGSRDVVVLDEAGMVGSRQMERLVSAVQEAGAKLVLVGDPEQLQAIEAGGAFRAIAERAGAVELTEIRRQREGWQQRATRELATGQTGAALARYGAAGMVVEHASQEAARAAVVAAWDGVRRESPEASQIILAHRRADVAALNETARGLRREAGELGPDHRLRTERGERALAEGERIYFLRNDRGLGVRNGTLGTLAAIDGERLTVRLDGEAGAGTGRAVSFALGDYGHIEHGYAATVHKSQGVTVDRAHVLASQGMDRHLAYVGLSRHREGVSLHWSPEEMGSQEGMVRRLSRERLKDTSLDYADGGIAPEKTGPREESGRQAYASRRGLSPLAPESGIVVERQAGRKDGLFAGLRLNAAPLQEAVPERRRAMDPLALDRAAERYVHAWREAQRMEERGLPVLAHQRLALDRAADRLEATAWARPGLARDLAAALHERPGLAPAELLGAAERAREHREAAAQREAEEKALAPLREHLLAARMEQWWRQEKPWLAAWERERSVPAGVVATVREGFQREIAALPAGEVRRQDAALTQREQAAAARKERELRQGPDLSL
jgi:Ti-type conjugative transfer relaxase TraA